MQTFVFADLAGFTALTEAHGDERAADIVDRFAACVADLLPEARAETIKTIGDALMIRVPEASDAVGLGLRIAGEVGGEHGFPLVHVGMHSGEAVERGGDWFGATVNVAARVASLAEGGAVLLTATTREAAGAIEGVQYRERGVETLRHVRDPQRMFEAVRTGAVSETGAPIDPVCRMVVHPGREAGRLVHRGAEYVFCSLECVSEFAADPDRFATAVEHP